MSWSSTSVNTRSRGLEEFLDISTSEVGRLVHSDVGDNDGRRMSKKDEWFVPGEQRAKLVDMCLLFC